MTIPPAPPNPLRGSLAKSGCGKLINMLSETDQTEKTLGAAQTARLTGTHPNARFLMGGH
jgi:hypothetical protein